MSHPIIHVEFSADDAKAAGRFYGAVFDWQIYEHDELNYVSFSWGDEGGGGFTPVQEGNPAGTVIAYIQIEDINATLEAINERGGQTVQPPMPVPGVGQIAIFTDPTGNRVGLVQPGDGEG